MMQHRKTSQAAQSMLAQANQQPQGVSSIITIIECLIFYLETKKVLN